MNRVSSNTNLSLAMHEELSVSKEVASSFITMVVQQGESLNEHGIVGQYQGIVSKIRKEMSVTEQRAKSFLTAALRQGRLMTNAQLVDIVNCFINLNGGLKIMRCYLNTCLPIDDIIDNISNLDNDSIYIDIIHKFILGYIDEFKCFPDSIDIDEVINWCRFSKKERQALFRVAHERGVSVNEVLDSEMYWC